MENSALVGLSRQVALRRELDIVANNLANIGTSGFKNEQVLFEEYLMPVARAEGFPRADRRLSYVQDKATWRDFSVGPVEVTGNNLDVALGEGAFLVVQTPAGERYTRAGSLQMDNEGRVVTASGHPVLTTAGVIQLAPEDGEIAIASDGTISTEEGPLGRLRLAGFDNLQALTEQGGGLYASAAPANEFAPGEARVTQGALERSNVQPITETTRLIEISRAYQSVASMLQRSDEMRRSAIERLAEVPA